MFREYLKSLSLRLWISRNFPLEMKEGGVKQLRVRTQKGVRIKRTCAYKGGGGSNFGHYGAYVLIEGLLFINNQRILCVPNGDSFKYLGRYFDLDMTNSIHKSNRRTS